MRLRRRLRVEPHIDKHALLALAAEIDAGFEQTEFADVLAYLSRYSDADLQLGDVVALRALLQRWVAETPGVDRHE